ncbi:DNA ligase D [Massilia yuzhufengensis]|uniref:DNA ligase (ATP) n=1 Tax=Massilia yuzhufengensis TaxID=1164594 RepID=A0A1I1PKF2_9BURK|nr:DNA ligase D [Massilia yuzhufengensis]SFD10127.1 ATP-dependent DNA ligase LigD phosphoesterase module /ATP-dependent DNA ligase LigD polymerase module [Massilia yuzhufengensis]
MPDALALYKAKRNFDITSEPAEGGVANTEALTFVIQKHWATRLHYDFRLELDGTMKSWAVPKGPSYDTLDKRMAVHVEDHPISYADFEGTIPPKQYGAGKVIIWDKGTWSPIGDPHEGYRKGNLKFEIRGHKMHGRWVLIRMKGRGDDKQEPWLLIKEKDEYARPADEFSVVDEMPDSVKKLPMPKPARAKVAALKAEADGDAPPKPARKRAAAKAPAKPAAKAAAKTTRSRKGSALAIPEGAVAAALPDDFAPELATLVDAPPHDPENWVFEVKFDGYRMLARVENGDVRLVTRNANDWTAKLKPLQDELARMALPDGWYDGEIVVNDEQGKPNFGLLQMAFDGVRTGDIAFFLFDAPYCGGYDLREVPLIERRAVLERVLKKAKSDKVRFSAEFGDNPAELVVAACKIGLEGVIGKRRDSRYVQRRSPEWIKLKCGLRQEFVIGGFTDPKGSRKGIGSLLLGTYDREGKLRYAGNVGSGFNHASLKDIAARLEALRTGDSPFPPRAVPGRQHHWVKPVLVAEVSFSEWTNTGSVRHPVFQGLREDKPARGITREEPRHIDDIAKPALADAPVKPPPAGLHGKLPESLRVTNPERVVDPSTGITKLDVIRYYALVGELMMEHLKRRPLTLVRAPSGISAELVFQKHADVKKLPGVKQMDAALDPSNPPMLEIVGVEGILSVAQWNAIELHTQNAFAKSYETPDRMVFDLDPGEGVEWPAMQEAAQIMHAFLEELGLPAFLKTSGGKGLHVVVPIKGEYGWDTVKAFSQAIVRHLAGTLPDRFAFKSGPKNRVGKIFIDYLRNGRGATTVCAWSARARPGMGISVPLAWDELPKLKSSTQWTVANVHTRLDKGNAPWEGFAKAAKGLSKAMKVLGFEP